MALERTVIGLGANLGDARQQLRRALDGLDGFEASLGLKVVGISALFRTAPWQTEGPDFLNAVAILEGPGDEQAPLRLLHALGQLERAHGRERPYRYAPRTLDLDIVLFGQRCIDTPELQVPHPRALQRDFVLMPLKTIWPACHWPGLGDRWLQALDALSQPGHPLRTAPQIVHDPEWPVRHLASDRSAVALAPGTLPTNTLPTNTGATGDHSTVAPDAPPPPTAA